jgi:hypothetical protein
MPSDGSLVPISDASAIFVVPATMPLTIAITTGSDDDSFRVRLLSRPHAKASAGNQDRTPVGLDSSSFQERTTAPANIEKTPMKAGDRRFMEPKPGDRHGGELREIQ